MEIIGNEEKPSYNGCFDIYVRGLGPMSDRDPFGRYYLYKKIQHGGVMPTSQQIIDKLVIIAL